MIWAPARLMCSRDSSMTRSRSIQPRSAAASIWEYSPEIWYAATGTGEIDALARILMDAWAKAEGPDNLVVRHPASYVATFADMARAVLALPAPTADPVGYIDVVFDGPPSHESGRFVEVEDPSGASIGVGEWIDRGNGLWALRIPVTAHLIGETT